MNESGAVGCWGEHRGQDDAEAEHADQRGLDARPPSITEPGVEADGKGDDGATKDQEINLLDDCVWCPDGAEGTDEVAHVAVSGCDVPVDDTQQPPGERSDHADEREAS